MKTCVNCQNEHVYIRKNGLCPACEEERLEIEKAETTKIIDRLDARIMQIKGLFPPGGRFDDYSTFSPKQVRDMLHHIKTGRGEEVQ